MTTFSILPSTGSSTLDFSHELQMAIELAREAGEIVKTFYQIPPAVSWKSSIKHSTDQDNEVEPVTEADRAANAYLVKQLAHIFPNDGILAEESKDDHSRLDKQRVWIVDPLDGTAEFIAHNGEFCTMIGLALDGVPVVGVVYQPVDDVLYAAAQSKGAFVEEFGERNALHVSSRDNIDHFRLVVSRSHRVELVDAIIARLGIQRERSIGSVGLKIGLIARGQADFYVHPNAGTKEWDTCAPEIIIREAGGSMTDCWNRQLRYNRADVVRHFGILASNATSHVQLAGIVDQVLDEAGVEPEFGF